MNERTHGILLIMLLVLGLAAPAAADLSYSYFEISGVPVLDNTQQDPLSDGDVPLDGSRVGGTLSIAVHSNWHFILTANNEFQESSNFLGLSHLGIRNDLNADRTVASFVPHFNYRVYDGAEGRPQVDVFAGLGVQYARVEARLNVDGDRSKDVETEFGVLVRAGARAMVWRDLELFGDFTGSNIGITRNELFFNLGARYHFLADRVDLGIGVGIGTDDFVGLSLSGRVYYAEVWRHLFAD